MHDDEGIYNIMPRVLKVPCIGFLDQVISTFNHCLELFFKDSQLLSKGSNFLVASSLPFARLFQLLSKIRQLLVASCDELDEIIVCGLHV